MSAPLIFAIPSKGRLKEQVEAWLADAGFGLEMSGGARGYRAALTGLPGAEVRLLSAADIAAALDSGEVHIGVTGEDLLRERGSDIESRVLLLRALGFGRADLVVAAPRSWLDVETMADLEEVAHDYLARTGRRLRVATPLARARASTTPSRRRTAASRSTVQSAESEAASWAWLFRITPSARILRLLAASVAPVVVMSTISSACPDAGAPSVAPPDSTMR